MGALRYRRGLAMAMALLAAFVTASLALGPLVTRALDQASSRVVFVDAAGTQTGLRLTSTAPPDSPERLTPADLARLVPPATAAYFTQPLLARIVDVRAEDGAGVLVASDGVCGRVRWIAGRCPSAAGEIGVASDASIATVALNQTRTVHEGGTTSDPTQSAGHSLTIVGRYEALPGPGANRVRELEEQPGPLGILLTAPATFDAADAPTAKWRKVGSVADFALDVDRLDADHVAALGAGVQAVLDAPPPSGTSVESTSGVPALASQFVASQGQVRQIVPNLTTQLGLLVACVLWLLMVAATDQRRPEVAVAKLRGQGVAGARRLLLSETLPAVLVGMPVGLLVALAATAVVRAILPGSAPFELPVGLWWGLAAALGLLIVLPALAVRAVAFEPVATLVRSVSARHRRLVIGAAETLIVVAAFVIFGGLATRTIGGPITVVAPVLLALAAGVLAAKVVGVGADALGRWLLRIGRAAQATAIINSARRGMLRWLVPLVTMVVCLAVFGAEATAVGAHNREQRAMAEVGAPAVLTVGGNDVRALVAAVSAADPSGRYATPVVAMLPNNDRGTATYAVVPDQFAAIATWPRGRPTADALGALTTRLPAVQVITGSHLRVTGNSSSLRGPGDVPVEAMPLDLAIRIAGIDGRVVAIPVATLTVRGGAFSTTTTIPCAQGCAFVGLAIVAPPTQSPPTVGTATIASAAVDGKPLNFGRAAAFTYAPADPTGAQVALVDATGEEGGLSVVFGTGDQAEVDVTSLAIPAAVPGLATAAVGNIDPADPTTTRSINRPDGTEVNLLAVGSLAYVPGGIPRAILTDVGPLSRVGWVSTTATHKIYVASEDPNRLEALRAALKGHGIPVLSTQTTSGYATTLARSGPAWSLALAVAVGVAALGVGILALLVLVAATWRARTRDLAALRLAGFGHGATVLAAAEEVLPTAVSVLIGAACGVLGGVVAISTLPLFSDSSPLLARDDSVVWPDALIVAAASLALFEGAAFVAARWVAHRSTFLRLRESA